MSKATSVLEKLKESKEQLDSLNCRDHETYESFLAVQLEANWRIYKILPRLIEALEWAEAELLKANGNFEAYCNRQETIETPCNINVEAAMQTQWLLTNLLQKLEGKK